MICNNISCPGELLKIQISIFKQRFSSDQILLLTVNGGWGTWNTWSSCSVTYGSGQRTTRRFCDNPPPSRDGSNCSGDSRWEKSYNTTSCPGEALYTTVRVSAHYKLQLQ